MTRADITKHLRKWGDTLSISAGYEDGIAKLNLEPKALDRLCEVIFAAAALLEDDTVERDARRWRVMAALSCFEEFSCCRVVEVQGYSTLQHCKRPELGFGLEEFEWHPTLDAAIDAWIEKEEARDRSPKHDDQARHVPDEKDE